MRDFDMAIFLPHNFATIGSFDDNHGTMTIVTVSLTAPVKEGCEPPTLS